MARGPGAGATGPGAKALVESVGDSAPGELAAVAVAPVPDRAETELLGSPTGAEDGSAWDAGVCMLRAALITRRMHSRRCLEPLHCRAHVILSE
jgi:hypothetical protein